MMTSSATKLHAMVASTCHSEIIRTKKQWQRVLEQDLLSFSVSYNGVFSMKTIQLPMTEES